jgi:hypothetical protein
VKSSEDDRNMSTGRYWTWGDVKTAWGYGQGVWGPCINPGGGGRDQPIQIQA